MKTLRFIQTILCLCLCLMLLCGCGLATLEPVRTDGENVNTESPETSQTPESPEAPETVPSPEVPEEPSPAPESETPAAEALLPADLPLEFEFSSGAGAWATRLTLDRDGRFTGQYSDADMGDMADEYPNGTLYTCRFNGSFSQIEQVDPNCYVMQLGALSLDGKEGEEEIGEDGVRYVYSTAYGIDPGSSFRLFGPDTKIADLPEDMLSWWPGRYEEVAPETLGCYGLYNEQEGTAFFSFGS